MGKDETKMADISIALFLLVLINILVTIGRQQKKRWLRILLVGLGFLLLFPALLFGLRGIS